MPLHPAKPPLPSALGLLGLCLMPPAAQAAEDLMDLSLEELLKVEVSLASQRSESISAAPAVMSRYEMDDMRRLGLHSLREVLAFLPGFVVQDSAIGTTPVMVRGAVEAFNQKILFLLDGVPYWQPSHGDVPLNGIPLEAISHVEVIRGPGAVIYGTNATGGVINVVTRRGQDGGAQAAYGDNAQHLLSLYQGGRFAHGGEYGLSLEARDEDGYSGHFTGRPVPASFPVKPPADGEQPRGERHHSLYARYGHAGFNAALHAYEAQSKGLAGAATLINRSDLEYQGLMLHLDQGWRGEAWELDLYSDYNRYYPEIPTEKLFGGVGDGLQNFSAHGEDNTRWRSGLRHRWRLGGDLSWLNGIETEERRIGDYRNSRRDTGEVRAVAMAGRENREDALISQLDYSLGDWRFLAGARYTDNELAGSDITPRASIVYALSEAQSLKLLHATGFNSPVFLQQFILIPPNALRGNPDLVAETVATTDLVYTWNRDNRLFVANLYRLKTEDLILRVPVAPGSVQFQNTDGYVRHGLELDFQAKAEDWLYFANLAWQREGNRRLRNDPSAFFAPRLSTNLGLAWQPNAWSLGLSWRHVGPRAEVPALDLLSLDARYRAGRAEVFLRLDNALGDEPISPDVQDFVPGREVPGGEARPGWLAGLRLRF